MIESPAKKGSPAKGQLAVSLNKGLFGVADLVCLQEKGCQTC